MGQLGSLDMSIQCLMYKNLRGPSLDLIRAMFSLHLEQDNPKPQIFRKVYSGACVFFVRFQYLLFVCLQMTLHIGLDVSPLVSKEQLKQHNKCTEIFVEFVCLINDISSLFVQL